MNQQTFNKLKEIVVRDHYFGLTPEIEDVNYLAFKIIQIIIKENYKSKLIKEVIEFTKATLSEDYLKQIIQLVASKNLSNEYVHAVLNLGADVHTPVDTKGNTLLHEASHIRSDLLLDVLVDTYNADVNKANNSKDNPLIIALESRHKYGIKKLLPITNIEEMPPEKQIFLLTKLMRDGSPNYLIISAIKRLPNLKDTFTSNYSLPAKATAYLSSPYEVLKEMIKQGYDINCVTYEECNDNPEYSLIRNLLRKSIIFMKNNKSIKNQIKSIKLLLDTEEYIITEHDIEAAIMVANGSDHTFTFSMDMPSPQLALIYPLLKEIIMSI